jgi:cyclic pyranopterin phosphate synthase
MTRLHLPVLGKPALPAVVPADPLLDGFARRIRCNYRCTYCMPETLGKEIEFQPRAAVLTFEEIEQIVSVFASLGVRKVRLTGGEPTVRHGIVDLVRRVAAVPGIEQVVMTTNGHLLGELAGPLREAGLQAVNVSIDTLDPDQFRSITSRGDLARVLAGIDAAVAAGLRVKTNAVALEGINDREIVALCEDAWRRGAVPRFIEHMPMSDGVLYEAARGIGAATIRRTIEAQLGSLVRAGGQAADAGPARYWALASDPTKQVGIISAMTEHFCDDCNRLRLTATGELHACLGHDDAVSLRDVVRNGGSPNDLIRAIAAAVSGKRAGHLFDSNAPTKHMIGIGG